MNKQEFLCNLKKAMCWSFYPDEIANKISDYESFFSERLKKGENEQEICDKMDNPKDIAYKLSIEMRKMEKSFFPLKTKRHMILATLLSFIGIGFIIFITGNYANIDVYSIIQVSLLIITFITVLWFALGNTFNELTPTPHLSSKKEKWKIFFFHTALVIFTVIYDVSINKVINEIIYGNNSSIFFNIKFFNNIRIIFITISISAIICLLYGFFCVNKHYFTVVCNIIGVVSYLGLIYNNITTMSSHEELTTLFSIPIFIYAISLIISFLIGLHIYTLLKNREQKMYRNEN